MTMGCNARDSTKITKMPMVPFAASPAMAKRRKKITKKENGPWNSSGRRADDADVKIRAEPKPKKNCQETAVKNPVIHMIYYDL